MRKTNRVILGFLLLTLSFSCQNKEKKEDSKIAEFNGIWSDLNTDDFDNCYAVFSQSGDSIHMGHYLEFKEQSFFESGSGIVKGDSLIYHVDVIKPIPAWGPEGGTHYLKLSKDKSTLEGIYITDSGNRGSLVFKRR